MRGGDGPLDLGGGGVSQKQAPVEPKAFKWHGITVRTERAMGEKREKKV